MTWSLAILDAGITNATLAGVGRSTVYEFDYLGGDPDTDNGVVRTHANDVFKAALSVSDAIDFIDLKIGNQFFQIDRLVSSGLQTLLDIGTEYHLAAINMSFSASNYPIYADQIAALASQGVITVAASGNSGSHEGREGLPFPARLPGVIAVGSHDGHGRPTDFSNNGPGVDVLADGENFPSVGRNGTSFSAPQVAATVTHVQAIVDGLTGNVLNVAQMVDVLQQGGAGPRSRSDPADGHTRYFLHDHDGSLDYAWSRYGGSPERALEYVASHRDLIDTLGADARAGQLHFEQHGSVEERPITFDGLDYIASYGDLISAFGAVPLAGAGHFITSGVREGRSINFDGLEYIATYDDLLRAFGANEPAGAIHFIADGHGEGRQTSFDGLEYIASHVDLIRAFGADRDAGAAHFIDHGHSEGRARDLFDAAQYLANNADLRAAFGSDEVAATQHFITTGYFEGRTDSTGVALTDFLV